MSAFLAEFLRSPLTVGALAPSGRALSEAAVAPIPSHGDPVVVELGPGTGTFTEQIQHRLGGRGRHIAVEINERFAARLAQRYPAIDVVTADAASLHAVLAERGISTVDVIISGLPWAAFSARKSLSILSSAVEVMSPLGAFTTFAYTPLRWVEAARRLRRALDAHFDEVLISRTIWANLPPALVYYCRRPSRLSSYEEAFVRDTPASLRRSSVPADTTDLLTRSRR